MVEGKMMNGPEKCHNCESHNVVGPFDQVEGRIFFGAFSYVRRHAFVCADCYHTMYFIIKKDEEKMKKEMEKLNRRYQ